MVGHTRKNRRIWTGYGPNCEWCAPATIWGGTGRDGAGAVASPRYPYGASILLANPAPQEENLRKGTSAKKTFVFMKCNHLHFPHHTPPLIVDHVQPNRPDA